MKSQVKQEIVMKINSNSFIYFILLKIAAWTVSGGVTSHAVLRQVRLYPEPASAISAKDISDTELTLSWKAPQGDWNSFEVSVSSFSSL